MKKTNLLLLIFLTFRVQFAIASEEKFYKLMTADMGPQVIQNMLQISWDEWSQHLEQQPWLAVYDFHKKLNSDVNQDLESNESEDFKVLLKDYCEKRLRQARSELEVEAAFELTPTNKNDFFNKKSYDHKKLEQRLTWSQMFSLVKHGEGEAASYFAEIIADSLLKKSTGEIKINPDDWAIATPAGHLGEPYEAKKASFVLSTKIAEILGIEIIPMYLQFSQQFYYCTVEDALTRFDMALTQYAPAETQKKNIIIVDDAIISGATIWGIKAAFDKQVSVSTYGIIDAQGVNFSVEEDLNNASTVDDRTIKIVLSDVDSLITNRTLKTFLKYPKEKIMEILGLLNDERLFYVYRTVQDSSRIVKSAGIASEEMAMIGNYVRVRGLKTDADVDTNLR